MIVPRRRSILGRTRTRQLLPAWIRLDLSIIPRLGSSGSVQTIRLRRGGFSDSILPLARARPHFPMTTEPPGRRLLLEIIPLESTMKRLAADRFTRRFQLRRRQLIRTRFIIA